MNINFKIWIEKDGQKILGRGPIALLKAVDELGSLRKAAFAMDMSYTKAWRLVTTLENALEISILEKRIGGSTGGSSTLTAEGIQLIERYCKMDEEINDALHGIYAKHFGS